MGFILVLAIAIAIAIVVRCKCWATPQFSSGFLRPVKVAADRFCFNTRTGQVWHRCNIQKQGEIDETSNLGNNRLFGAFVDRRCCFAGCRCQLAERVNRGSGNSQCSVASPVASARVAGGVDAACDHRTAKDWPYRSVGFACQCFCLDWADVGLAAAGDLGGLGLGAGDDAGNSGWHSHAGVSQPKNAACFLSPCFQP